MAGSGHLPLPGIRGKVTLKGRRTGLRRRENRGAGREGVSEQGELSRIPGPGREPGLSRSGAAGEASRDQGEAEEHGVNKTPCLIELYVIIRDLIYIIPEWSSGLPYFLQFESEFGNKEFMI